MLPSVITSEVRTSYYEHRQSKGLERQPQGGLRFEVMVGRDNKIRPHAITEARTSDRRLGRLVQ